MSIENLSDVPLYAARPSRHVPPKRKAASWIVVFIIHLLFINTLIFSQNWVTLPLQQRGVATEVTLDLRGATDRPNAPEVRMTVPQAPLGVPPELTIDPVIIPPSPDAITPRAERAPLSDGDLLGAIGRDVACSAGNYENLTAAQRGRCSRIPFQGAMLPNGAIVLREPAPNRFAPPEPEVRMSGADAQRRQMETGLNNPCPAILNIPCITVPGRN